MAENSTPGYLLSWNPLVLGATDESMITTGAESNLKPRM